MAINKVGTAVGFAMGGPFGAAVGSQADTLFGRGEASGYSRSDIERLTNARHQQIQDFSNQLMQARQRYLTNLNNFQNLAFKRFAPIAEAQFAGRGLNVTGGAFQSELAKQAANAQAAGALEASNMERQDLGNVQNAFGGLATQQIQGAYANPFQRAPNPFLQFAGQTAGDATRLALMKALGPAGGSVVGQGQSNLAAGGHPNYYGYGQP